MDAAMLKDYQRLKAQAAKKQVWNKEFKRKQRAQKKLEEGLDPALHRNAAQREGESDEAHAERLRVNRSKAEWYHAKRQAVRDGTWEPRRKLTPEERRRQPVPSHPSERR